MKDRIRPKAENAEIGFHYTVTDEQIEAHRKRSLEEIFKWLEETTKFIYMVQTPEERKRSRELKNKAIGAF